MRLLPKIECLIMVKRDKFFFFFFLDSASFISLKTDAQRCTQVLSQDNRKLSSSAV